MFGPFFLRTAHHCKILYLILHPFHIEDLNVFTQLQKMLHLRGKAVEEDRKDSGGEQRDEDEGLGPRSNISLLDQHQHLKEKAEGVWILHICHLNL